MWTSFYGYAAEKTQFRKGEGISELEDMQNETQMGQKELKNRTEHLRAEGQYQTI